MSVSSAIRQTHRWVSLTFMISVVVTSVALALKTPAVWVTYLPLPFLFLLMITGLYLFVLPYVSRWRGRGLEETSRAPKS